MKDENGKRYGILNGTNPDGPNSFFLQFTATTFSFLPRAVKSGTQFVKRIAEAAKNNAVLIITDPKFLPKPIVEGLIKRYGEEMAGSLARMQTIMPYSRASMFTDGWRQLYQAHHILEVNMAQFIGINDATHLPAIILTDLKHKAITNELNTARTNILIAAKKGIKDPLSSAELWQLYQTVYGKEHPIWLESIKSYFGK